MAYHATDPAAAQEIAAHAVMVLRLVRDADSLTALDRHYHGWLSYADQRRVCRAIRDHLERAASEVGVALKAARKIAARDPSDGTVRASG